VHHDTLDVSAMNDRQLVAGAARILGVTPAMVRVYADKGVLPCERIDGMRIFRRSDVQRLKAQREKALTPVDTTP
jgi:predicted site-specific integrase-resolvase